MTNHQRMIKPQVQSTWQPGLAKRSVIGHLPFPIGHWSLVIGHFPSAYLLCLLFCLLTPAFAATPTPAFEAANKLYFEGKFADAAAAYEKLLPFAPGSALLYFNLGNAYFKAGQKGRAIAAYLRARQLDPRDPALRFNLKFVREKVTGSDKPVGNAWQRGLESLTLNEWTLLSAGAFWLWMVLLAVREAWPVLRPGLRSYTLLAAMLTIVMIACCLGAMTAQRRVTTAVVVVPEGVVRQGPVARSSVAFKLPDGSELTVLDRQEIADQDQKQTWYQVQDAAKRIGWLKREEVIVLAGQA